MGDIAHETRHFLSFVAHRYVVGDNYFVSGTISAQNTGENTAIMEDVKDCIEYKGSVPGSGPDGFTPCRLHLSFFK
jgi:hypothetical protein